MCVVVCVLEKAVDRGFATGVIVKNAVIGDSVHAVVESFVGVVVVAVDEEVFRIVKVNGRFVVAFAVLLAVAERVVFDEALSAVVNELRAAVDVVTCVDTVNLVSLSVVIGIFVGNVAEIVDVVEGSVRDVFAGFAGVDVCFVAVLAVVVDKTVRVLVPLVFGLTVGCLETDSVGSDTVCDFAGVVCIDVTTGLVVVVVTKRTQT